MMYFVPHTHGLHFLFLSLFFSIYPFCVIKNTQYFIRTHWDVSLVVTLGILNFSVGKEGCLSWDIG